MSEGAQISNLYPARPTVELSNEAQPELSDRIRSLRISEEEDGLYACELTLTNWGNTDRRVDFLYFDRDLIDFGTPIAVRLGSGAAEDVAFDGHITAIEGRFPRGRAPELRVLAEDRLFDLRMTRRTRTFEDLTDAEVFQQIARDHDMTGDITLNGPTHRALAQVNQSDLAFLRDRARAVGAELWVEGDRLMACDRADRAGEPVSLRYGQRLQQFSVMADLAHQASAWVVTGWDVAQKQAISVEAGDTSLQTELGSMTSGASILDQAFGRRVQRMVHTSPQDQDEAQAHAEAAFRRSARRFCTGRGVAEGDARIRVGARVSLEGLGPLFDGEYPVTWVEHTYDLESGLSTHFGVERPGLRGG
ncbi:MAG: phage late control D family protein [Deltaproteobacteria bacterium]|nr:phage late control D family protein [Deltaproteobacteria bacterium]